MRPDRLLEKSAAGKAERARNPEPSLILMLRPSDAAMGIGLGFRAY